MKMRILHLILSLFVQVNWFEQATGEFKPFYCNTPKLQMELTGSSIKRFTGYKEDYYLILKNKIIKFRAPVVYSSANKSEVFMLTFQPFVYEGIDEVDGESPIGYMVYKNESRTIELYFDYKNETDYSFSSIELNFDEVPAKRMSNNSSPVRWPFDEDKLQSEFLVRVNWLSKLKCFVLYVAKKAYFSLMWSEQSIYPSETRYESGQLFRKANDSAPWTHKFAFGAFYLYDNDVRLLNNASMVEIDRQASMMLFKKLNIHGNEMLINTLAAKDNHIESSMIDFFSCPKEFTNPSEVKGIFFEGKLNMFYIFIKHFYLPICENMVDLNFRLYESDYANKEELRFESDEVTKGVVFEELQSKYIRIYDKDNTLLIMFDQYFKLRSAGNNALAIKKLDYDKKRNIVLKCLKQTLTIENYVFCFEGTQYFLQGDLNKEKLVPLIRYDVKTIFENSNQTSNDSTPYDNQAVEFIFNYIDDHFILMTRTNFYVIKYKWMVVKNDLTLAFKADHKLRAIRNCLFEKCEKLGDQTDKLEVNNDKKSTNMFFLAGGAGGLIFFILLVSMIVMCRGRSSKVDQIETKSQSTSSKIGEMDSMH